VRSQARLRLAPDYPTYPPLGVNATGLFFDCTIGGTTLVSSTQEEFSPTYDATGAYMVISADVIYEYERRIAELRLELLHYKRMVVRLFAQGQTPEEFEPNPILPLDSASTRLVNSIVDARTPSGAIFRDFQEGEL
jgi:hypothetical protein